MVQEATQMLMQQPIDMQKTGKAPMWYYYNQESFKWLAETNRTKYHFCKVFLFQICFVAE
jgi:hypothetical protein